MEELRPHLPAGTIECWDDTGAGGMGNFLKAMTLAGQHPTVHMEDDIVLTRNFEAKIREAVAQRPDVAIQFFSMRKADLEIGSRWEPGRTFMMNQCHYAPAPHSMDYYWFWQTWPEYKKTKHPHGYDILIADYLATTGQKYWLHVPSLVDHRVCKSIIDPRRASTNRQSLTFTDPEQFQ